MMVSNRPSRDLNQVYGPRIVTGPIAQVNRLTQHPGHGETVPRKEEKVKSRRALWPDTVKLKRPEGVSYPLPCLGAPPLSFSRGPGASYHSICKISYDETSHRQRMDFYGGKVSGCHFDLIHIMISKYSIGAICHGYREKAQENTEWSHPEACRQEYGTVSTNQSRNV